MSNITTACTIRRSKILIVLMVGIFGLTTLVNNFTDYTSYYEYIGQILSMSTTEGNESRRYRAVTSGLFHHRFYWMIITLETIYTVFCLLGVYQLCRKMNASRKEFKVAKKFAVLGLITAIVVYYFMYVIILSEWFDVEYSAQSNAFDWARSNIEYMFPALIYLTLDNDN
ncbi:hypothetical protein C1886_08860 [Pseudomonas sp. FW300-N1A1]|uniref:DUF2165 domain-containing protein n=1 Tax=Pseudomonas sp. FW300-N1A1 TaxID=2075555 RepID=UPI000CD2C9A0|nr:DUF2165 domain-containing protein [Pseudomonas sp. FW300-N1A1]POA20501.1 hypothetical protein C1886_08860 [Pseudomonas sp. FW300-N1A1]